MRDITIALVDSGINYNDPFFQPYIKDGFNFLNGGTEKYIDDNGHGSLCASAIIKENPNARLFVEKILDKNNMSTQDILEKGLMRLMEEDVQIISLSLSLTSMQSENKVKNLCKELNRQNKIIICTLANGVEKSYPANYQSTVGVRGFILEDQNSFWFNRKKRIQAVVDTNPYMLRNGQNSYQLFGKCNSFSAAKFSGIISRIMQENNIWGREHLENQLEKLSSRSNWTKTDLMASKRFPEFNPNSSYNYVLVKKVSKIITDFVGLEDTGLIYEHNLFDSHIGLNYVNVYSLLQKIQTEIGIEIKDYTQISRYDFYSIYTLVSLIEKEWKNDQRK